MILFLTSSQCFRILFDTSFVKIGGMLLSGTTNNYVILVYFLKNEKCNPPGWDELFSLKILLFWITQSTDPNNLFTQTNAWSIVYACAYDCPNYPIECCGKNTPQWVNPTFYFLSPPPLSTDCVCLERRPRCVSREGVFSRPNDRRTGLTLSHSAVDRGCLEIVCVGAVCCVKTNDQSSLDF